MRHLLLMRHAKAVREPGLPDHARGLTERGRDDAVRVARYLHEHRLAPDLALASDSRRTRETLELAATAFPQAPETRLEPRLYLADPRDILKVVRAAPASAHTLLLVGHNPGLAELAGALAGAGAPRELHRLAEGFPTAAVAVIAFDDHWSELAELRGSLERFITAKPLRESARAPEPHS